MKVVLLTGASSGIGYQTAEMLAKQGHKVYGAARRVEKIEPLKGVGVTPLKLDVTDESSLKQAVEEVIAKEGRIDVLINSAGYGSYGPVECVSIGEAKRQLEVNVFGVARLIQMVLPYMRKQGSGRIISLSSIGGRVTSFMGAWYHASKYALEALHDALRMETAQFGIDVVLIEPGGVKTDWGFIAADHLEATGKGSAYEGITSRVAAGMRKQYSSNTMLSDVAVVSKAISKVVSARRPQPRYLMGFGAKPIVFLHKFLPARAFDWIMMHVN